MLQNQSITVELVVMVFAVVSVAIAVVLYLGNKFQTKEEAAKSENGLKEHIELLESDVTNVQSSLARISQDVSYIRGRLEPKT